jgi:SnoaL-like polyketide cyclase
MTQVKSISELNKLNVRLFVEAVWNEGRLELIDQLVAADYIGHFSWTETAVAGPGGVSRLVSGRRRAHPGLYVKIEDQIAEDDRVVTCWQATTAAPGAGPAGAPARRTPSCTGISVIRFLAGKQVDSLTECSDLTVAAGRASHERTALQLNRDSRSLSAISLSLRADLPHRSRRNRAP